MLQQVANVLSHASSVHFEHSQPGQLGAHPNEDIVEFLQPQVSWWWQNCTSELTELRKGVSEATNGPQGLPSQVGRCRDYGNGVPASHQPCFAGKFHYLDCPSHQLLLVFHKLGRETRGILKKFEAAKREPPEMPLDKIDCCVRCESTRSKRECSVKAAGAERMALLAGQ